jgi:hypothetical protein
MYRTAVKEDIFLPGQNMPSIRIEKKSDTTFPGLVVEGYVIATSLNCIWHIVNR